MASTSHRIVSLLPGATEMLCALGLADQLVGVSHECDYPEEVQRLPRVTRSRLPAGADSATIDHLVREMSRAGEPLYELDEGMIAALHPTVVVGQSLCNVCAISEGAVQKAIQRLRPAPKVIYLSPTTLSDMSRDALRLGELVGAREGTKRIVEQWKSRIDTVKERVTRSRFTPRVAFLEWLDPPFCAGHWTPELVELAGGVNLIGEAGHPSRRIGWQEVIASEPDVIVIACCGYSVAQARADWERMLRTQEGLKDLSPVRQGRVHFFDGSSYFNRPGPRLVDSLELLARALHRECFTEDATNGIDLALRDARGIR